MQTRLTARNARVARGGCRRSRGFTLVELLVVIAIISIIAGFLVPTLLSGRAEAYKVQCANNLKEIGKLASMYADSAGNRFFPFGKGGDPAAHESLNRLIKFHGSARKVPPKLFICQTWREGEAAVPDENNKYELDEYTNSYAWTGRRLSPTDAGYALASDKYYKQEGSDQMNGHDQGLNVLYTDMSVTFVRVEELGDTENDLPEGLTR